MDDKYIKYSHITGRTYNIFECVRILNIEQAIFYIKHNVKLMDLQISENHKTNKPIFVYIFKKKDTHEAYDLWCRNKEGDGLEAVRN